MRTTRQTIPPSILTWITTVGLILEDVDTLTVDLGDTARTIGGTGLEAQANNDTAVTIAGTNDITMTDELATGALTMGVDDAASRKSTRTAPWLWRTAAT